MNSHPGNTEPSHVPVPSILLGLALAALLVYGRILGHEFLMTWDDRLYVVHNEAIRGFSWSHLREVFSRFYVGNFAPLQMISYMIDYEIWGLAAGGFLLTNILLHLSNGLLFFRLLEKMHGKQMLAIVGAATFLLHPVQVESVAWVSQRKNLLAMFFFLLAWLWYEKYRSTCGSRKRLAYMASLAAMLLAVLSKSISVIFPLAMMAYDYCFSCDERRFRPADKLPYGAVSLAAAGMTLVSQAPLEDNWGAAAGGGMVGFHGGSPLATFLTMLTVACRYLGMLVWPSGLSAAYAPAVRQNIDMKVIGASIVLVLLAILSWLLFRSERKLGFWPVFIITAFVPVSQVVPLVTMMNDRYLYFPMLGAGALAGAGAVLLRERMAGSHRITTALIAVPLVLLSAVSFTRAGVWRDDITFGRDTTVRCPTSYTAWEGLGEAYYFSEPSRTVEAAEAYNRALALNPSSTLTLYNLGVLYVESGDDELGSALLSRVVMLNNRHAAAWSYIGDISFRRGKYEQARSAYLSMEASGQPAPEAPFRLACIEAVANRPDEALNWLETALRRGWHDCDRLRNSGELSRLRNSDRFKNLEQTYCSGDVQLQ